MTHILGVRNNSLHRGTSVTYPSVVFVLEFGLVFDLFDLVVLDLVVLDLVVLDLVVLAALVGLVETVLNCFVGFFEPSVVFEYLISPGTP